MIKVWTDKAEAGLLDRNGERGSAFSYLPDADAARAVSVTMSVRLPSWSVPYGLPPIFEMNLPEGFLRERLRLAFAKATGTFDEFDLLSVVGRSQVGRIRYSGDKEQLREDVPFQSVDEILERRRGGELFRHLLEKFASFSGISGVQPKFLVRDEKAFAEGALAGHRLTQSHRGATHIVKLWDATEYPQLAANEYFCLSAARKCGLAVPPVRLHGCGGEPGGAGFEQPKGKGGDETPRLPLKISLAADFDGMDAAAMEFRHIRYFITVAEEKHFGKAALRLGISQPPLSQQIQSLEHEVGTKLLDRSHHRVALTKAGEIFLEEAYKLLRHYEQFRQTIAQAISGELGQLNIACVPSAFYEIIPPIIQRFKNSIRLNYKFTLKALGYCCIAFNMFLSRYRNFTKRNFSG